jgi:hypothetical protein
VGLSRAAPRPVRDAPAEPGTDGIRANVAAGVLQVVVVGDQARLEAALEQMADPTVAGVEARRVQAVQALHPLRERRLTALDDQVEVVPHQAVNVQLPGELLGDAEQHVDEEVPVIVVHEDRAPVDTARRQVVDAVRERRAQRARHDRQPTASRPAGKPLWTNRDALVPNDRAVPSTSRASPWTRPNGTGIVRNGHVQGLALEMSAAVTSAEEVSDQERR